MNIGRLTCTAVILVVLVLIQNTLALANHTATAAEYHMVYNDDPPHSVKLTTSSASQDPDCSHSRQWFCFNLTTKTYSCLHGSDSYLRCSEYRPLLKLGYCATYSDDTGLLTIAKCPYFQINSKGYNVTITGDGYYVHIPTKDTRWAQWLHVWTNEQKGYCLQRMYWRLWALGNVNWLQVC